MADEHVESIWRTSFALHVVVLSWITMVHGALAYHNPGSAHNVVATTFLVLVVHRLMLHTVGFSLNEDYAELLWSRALVLCAIACPGACAFTGLKIPHGDNLSFSFMCISYVLGIFSVLVFASFPPVHKALILLGHVGFIPAVYPPPGMNDSTKVALMLSAVMLGSVSALLVDYALSVQSARKRQTGEPVGKGARSRGRAGGSQRGKEKGIVNVDHLIDMVKQLAADEAQLLDVREAHELAAHGTLNGSVHFPLSSMTEGQSAPAELDMGKTVYIFCAAGIRVHAARDSLVTLGFEPERTIALVEGYRVLVKHGQTRPELSLLRPDETPGAYQTSSRPNPLNSSVSSLASLANSDDSDPNSFSRSSTRDSGPRGSASASDEVVQSGASATSLSAHNTAQALSELRILIVDNDKHSLEELDTACKAHGHVTETTTDCRDAVVLVESSGKHGTPFDVCLIEMAVSEAEISRVKMLRIFRKVLAPHAALLMMSANDRLAKQMVFYGADGFLIKPITVADIIPSLWKYVSRRQQWHATAQTRTGSWSSFGGSRSISTAPSFINGSHSFGSREGRSDNSTGSVSSGAVGAMTSSERVSGDRRYHSDQGSVLVAAFGTLREQSSAQPLEPPAPPPDARASPTTEAGSHPSNSQAVIPNSPTVNLPSSVASDSDTVKGDASSSAGGSTGRGRRLSADISDLVGHGAGESASNSEMADWLDRRLDSAFPGGRIADLSRFEWVEELGHGTFAQVALLRELSTRQFAVAKQIALGSLKRKEVRQIITEVEVLARIRHPHIIVLHGFHYEASGRLSLIMDYAAGGTVERLIQRSESCNWELSVLDVTLWLSQLASALHYMHRRRILHRDLSSGNVFITFDGDVVLGDFGLSHKLEELPKPEVLPGDVDGNLNEGPEGDASRPGSLNNSFKGSVGVGGSMALFAKTMCGTPSYMSPELINGEEYGKPNDVWAFGVIVFQMLTLRMPFTSRSLAGLVCNIMASKYDPEALEVLDRRELPPELRKLISSEKGGSLHRVPEDRITFSQIVREFPLRAYSAAKPKAKASDSSNASATPTTTTESV